MQQPVPDAAEVDESSSRSPTSPASAAHVASTGDTRVEAMMAAHQKVLTDRLEEGLRSIQRTSITLMQEIAAEVWRVSGGDKAAIQTSLLESLSRDHAIRGLIAHSDERFQTLSLRSQRLEDLLGSIAESSVATKRAVAEGVQALRETSDSASVQGVEDVKAQLGQIERHLAATFERLDERDRLLLGQLQEQIRDYGAIVRHETGRIVEALEGYVKDGVGAIGQLAQRIEQQTEMMYERVGMDTRSITEALETHESWVLRTLEASSARVDESLESQVGKVREAATDVGREINRSLEQRVQQLGELVRSDSDTLRQEIHTVAAAQIERLGEAMEERVARSEHELQARLGDAVSVIDRNMVRVAETLESELDRLGQRATQAVDEAVERRFAATLAGISASAEAVERGLDDRIAALARMIRADNRVIAEQLRSLSEHEQAKQALRAVKELQASLPGEITGTLERKLAALHQALSRSDEAIAQKVDRLAARIGTPQPRYDQDIQSVIERMGDAMHALASLGRVPPDRIEVD